MAKDKEKKEKEEEKDEKDDNKKEKDKDKKEKKDDKETDADKDAEGEGAEGEDGAEGEAKPKLSKKKKIIIAAAAAVVLIGGGVGAFLMLGSSHPPVEGEDGAEGEDGEHGKKSKAPEIVYYDLPAVMVNLNTGGKQTSFIKATITLELANADAKSEIEAVLPRVMDSFNTYLREMRTTDLQGSAGVYRLREELLIRINKYVGPGRVNDVLFKEILVQ